MIWIIIYFRDKNEKYLKYIVGNEYYTFFTNIIFN